MKYFPPLQAEHLLDEVGIGEDGCRRDALIFLEDCAHICAIFFSPQSPLLGEYSGSPFPPF